MRINKYRRTPIFLVLLIVATISGIACTATAGVAQDAEAASVPVTDAPQQGRILTLGDISDEPVKKIERFKPLAEYLAAQMSELGFTGGDVIIARDVDEMAELVASGKVDVFMDSAYPALKVQELAQTELILRRWKSGESSYHSIFVTTDAQAIPSIESLGGRIIAGENEYSTSGYALPIIALVATGFDIEIVPGPQTKVPDTTVGIWFTRDEENTFDALANGFVNVAIMSNQDLDKVPEALLARLVEIGKTGTVPRQVVSASPHLDAAARSEIARLLIGLEDFDEGIELLDHVKTARFDLIPAGDRDTLSDLEKLLPIIP